MGGSLSKLVIFGFLFLIIWDGGCSAINEVCLQGERFFGQFK